MDPQFYPPEPSQHGQNSSYGVKPLQLPPDPYEQDDDTESIVTTQGDPKQTKFEINNALNASAILKLVALILLVTAHGFIYEKNVDKSVENKIINDTLFRIVNSCSMSRSALHSAAQKLE